VSLFGLLSNGFSLYITRTRSLFRSAFGALCSSYLICNLEAIVLLLIWCTIVLSVKPPTLSSSTIFSIRRIGERSVVWIAFCRLCAIAYPIKYKELWSETKAFAAGIFSWTVGTFLCMLQLYKGCSFVFNGNWNHIFSYQNSFYGKICACTDTIISIGIIAATGCIDFITLVKILEYRRTIRENKVFSVVSVIKERDVSFFKQ
ncbi:hypothetical protein LOAG_14510, partial [Loa loa]